MYANTLAFAYALQPPTQNSMRRVLFATLSFASGGIVGWPFSAAIAIPFVLEELSLAGADKVTEENYGTWLAERWMHMITAATVSVLLVVCLVLLLVSACVPNGTPSEQIPVIAMDTLFYGKLAVVPWNIVHYNVFPDSSRGPELYGTEPVHFYLSNLLLNFNVLVPFALLALPALAITYRVDTKRLGERYQYVNQSSPYTLLAVRLAPAYLWVMIMTAQKHKEERFMYPIYPLIVFNAAVAIYLVRGWLEAAFIAVTSSPYKVRNISGVQRADNIY